MNTNKVQHAKQNMDAIAKTCFTLRERIRNQANAKKTPTKDHRKIMIFAIVQPKIFPTAAAGK